MVGGYRCRVEMKRCRSSQSSTMETVYGNIPHGLMRYYDRLCLLLINVVTMIDHGTSLATRPSRLEAVAVDQFESLLVRLRSYTLI
jgi:hypothetical protein